MLHKGLLLAINLQFWSAFLSPLHLWLYPKCNCLWTCSPTCCTPQSLCAVNPLDKPRLGINLLFFSKKIAQKDREKKVVSADEKATTCFAEDILFFITPYSCPSPFFLNAEHYNYIEQTVLFLKTMMYVSISKLIGLTVKILFCNLESIFILLQPMIYQEQKLLLCFHWQTHQMNDSTFVIKHWSFLARLFKSLIRMLM